MIWYTNFMDKIRANSCTKMLITAIRAEPQLQKTGLIGNK